MTEYKFPTEEVNLPSKGVLYPKSNPLSSGKVELKYMTAKEEDILTSINLIRKGIVLDKVLESLVVNKKIKVDDMLIGDKNALIIAIRILGYGKNYEVTAVCEDCSEESALEVDCTKFKDVEVAKGVKENKFSMELPNTKAVLEFKLLNSAEESLVDKDVSALQRVQPDYDYTNTFRFKRMILSVNGDTREAVINDFVDNQFLSIDSLAFRTNLIKVTPDIELSVPIELDDGEVEEVAVPVTVQFFWPSS